MFMNLKIKPKVGDLVRVNDPYFDDDTCGYCIESEEKFFTLRYFDDASRQYDFDYWYEEEYDLEMSIISSTQQYANDFGGLNKLNKISRLVILNKIKQLCRSQKLQ